MNACSFIAGNGAKLAGQIQVSPAQLELPGDVAGHPREAPDMLIEPRIPVDVYSGAYR